METQSSQTKRCWTTAKVQHEKWIATVNQLEKLALWHWPRELLIREWISEMTCKEKRNIVLFSAKLTDNLCTHCCCGRHQWCSGDHMVQRCECESRWLFVSPCGTFGKATTCPGCDSEPEAAGIDSTSPHRPVQEVHGDYYGWPWLCWTMAKVNGNVVTGTWQACHQVDGVWIKTGAKMADGQWNKREQKTTTTQKSVIMNNGNLRFRLAYAYFRYHNWNAKAITALCPKQGVN